MALIKVPERDPQKYRKIIGIDSASTGIAWTYLKDGKMEHQGKIKLDKIKDVPSKLAAIYEGMESLFESFDPDHVFVEKSIFVRNPATARLLSYVVGTIIVSCSSNGYEVTDVEPSTWKSFLGYKNLSSKFVQQAKTTLGATEGKKFCDKLRKSQTWRVIAHNYPQQAENSSAITDNDIADSWGIALYGFDKLATHLELEISKDISLDTGELGRLGLTL